MAQYRKFLVAIVGAVAANLSQSQLSNHWVAVGLSIATVLGVYAVPNAAG